MTRFVYIRADFDFASKVVASAFDDRRGQLCELRYG